MPFNNTGLVGSNKSAYETLEKKLTQAIDEVNERLDECASSDDVLELKLLIENYDGASLWGAF